MAKIRGDNHAFGWPGLEPRWTHGDKDGIGIALLGCQPDLVYRLERYSRCRSLSTRGKPEYLTVELLRLLRMSEVVDGTEGRSRGWLHSKRYREPQESLL